MRYDFSYSFGSLQFQYWRICVFVRFFVLALSFLFAALIFPAQFLFEWTKKKNKHNNQLDNYLLFFFFFFFCCRHEIDFSMQMFDIYYGCRSNNNNNNKLWEWSRRKKEQKYRHTSAAHNALFIWQTHTQATRSFQSRLTSFFRCLCTRLRCNALPTDQSVRKPKWRTHQHWIQWASALCMIFFTFS